LRVLDVRGAAGSFLVLRNLRPVLRRSAPQSKSGFSDILCVAVGEKNRPTCGARTKRTKFKKRMEERKGSRKARR
jgi:hypothetical protein